MDWTGFTILVSKITLSFAVSVYTGLATYGVARKFLDWLY